MTEHENIFQNERPYLYSLLLVDNLKAAGKEQGRCAHRVDSFNFSTTIQVMAPLDTHLLVDSVPPLAGEETRK